MSTPWAGEIQCAVLSLFAMIFFLAGFASMVATPRSVPATWFTAGLLCVLTVKVHDFRRSVDRRP